MRFILSSIAILSLAFSAIALPLSAQESGSEQTRPAKPLEARAADVLLVMKGRKQAEDVFSTSFLAQISSTQLTALSGQLKAQFGEPLAVENLQSFSLYKAAFDLRMERGIGKVEMALQPNQSNRISELLIKRVDPPNASLNTGSNDGDLATITNRLNALPGDVSAYFGPLDGTNPKISINPNQQMAIGSTFKLYVLSALARKIAAGDANWDDTHTLTRPSFPSGMTQKWPRSAPMTLQSMATLMISISDNTATDSLIEYLGADAVYDEVEESGHSQAGLNWPFMTTRQMFSLKAGGDTNIANYRRLSPAAKVAALDRLDKANIVQDDVERAFANGPYALDIEWFANAHDLRKMLGHVLYNRDDKVLQIMGINPSAFPSFFQQYPRIYYKGGNEPGVINYTWLMMDKQQQWHVLVLSWSNADAVIKESMMEEIAQSIFALQF